LFVGLCAFICCILYNTMHQINIIVHVLAGAVALLVGLAALLFAAKYSWHVRLGRVFAWAMVPVIITGLAGVVVFQRNSFLLVITVLSGYTCFAGIRTLNLRGATPGCVDVVVPICAMASGVYYLYYLQVHGHYWAPVVTVSGVGALFLITLYDLSRSFLSSAFRKSAMQYEHVYKMMSSLTGLISAFSGTVLPHYKPYSQFVPNVVSLVCTLFIFIGIYNGRRSSRKNVILRNSKQDEARS